MKLQRIKFFFSESGEGQVDEANLLFTSEENKGLSEERKMKMLPFYTEGDKRWAQ